MCGLPGNSCVATQMHRLALLPKCLIWANTEMCQGGYTLLHTEPADESMLL